MMSTGSASRASADESDGGFEPVTVTAGYAGAFVSGRQLPVRVTVRANRLVRGELRADIEADGRKHTVSMPVEAPGGTVKQFAFVASGATTQGQVNIKVEVSSEKTVVGSATTTLSVARDQELVGLTTSVLAGRPVPGPAPLAIDVGTARFAELTEGDLGAAPAALDSLSSIAIVPDELSHLSKDTVNAVLLWVQNGGRLLVDGTDGPIAGIPAAWKPGSTGRVKAGRGDIIRTGDALAKGRWDRLVEPRAMLATSTATQGFADSPPLSQTLARQAGLRLPEARWLAGYFAFYILLVGPLCWVLLRRSRREHLAWLVVPVVGLLFSGGAVVVGRGLRASRPTAHASVLSTGVAGNVERTTIGVLSGGPSSMGVQFPKGWTVTEDVENGIGNPPLVAVGSDGPSASRRLEAAQFAMISGSGPSDVAGGLIVTAKADGSKVTGTVRNTLPFNVRQVAILVGSDVAQVGGVGAGEEHPWEVTRNPAARQPLFASRIWPGSAVSTSGFPGGNKVTNINGRIVVQSPNGGFTTVPGPVTTDVDGSLFASAVGRELPAVPDTGTAIAAGWVVDRAPPARVRGGGRTQAGHTLVLGESAIADTASVEMVRGGTTDMKGAVMMAGTDGVVFRLVVPDSMAGKTLRLSLPSVPISGAEASVGDGWQSIAPNRTGGSTPPPVPTPRGTTATTVIFGNTMFNNTQLELPQDSVRNGVAYVRLRTPGVVPLFAMFSLAVEAS